MTTYKESLPYTIISNTIQEKKYLWAHLHCYNIDTFEEIYTPYLKQISNNFNIIVTYCIGSYKPNIECILLHCENRGMDIGAKIIFMDYISKENIDSSHILFLHSKNCPNLRKHIFGQL